MSRNQKTFSDKWIECRVAADVSSLPAEIELAIPLHKSLPYAGFALFWILASILLMADASKDGPGGALFGLFFIGVGAVMLVHFSSRLGARQITVLTKDSVTVRDTSWLRPTRTWHKPYTDFEGVVMRQCKTSTDNHTTYYQIIELLHADRDYIVPLYIHPEMGAPRKILQACADTFHLPALRATSNTFASVEPFTG